jgi:predicted TPR repeat methyltransferase
LRHRDLIRFWDVKASAYCEMEAEEGVRRAQTIMHHLPITEETTILDIGSGPGTLSIPLSRAAKRVTAVDPSMQMLRALKDSALKSSLTNIRAINRRWEDVCVDRDVEKHDIVIASYALAMPDLQEALSKMDRAAKRAVYLYWYADGLPNSVYSDLWPRLFNGASYVHFPDYIYVVNILHRLGIYADTWIEDDRSQARFSSFEEAVNYWRQSLKITSSDHTNILRDHLSKKLVQRDGALWLKRRARMACIFWRKHAPDET